MASKQGPRIAVAVVVLALVALGIWMMSGVDTGPDVADREIRQPQVAQAPIVEKAEPPARPMAAEAGGGLPALGQGGVLGQRTASPGNDPMVASATRATSGGNGPNGPMRKVDLREAAMRAVERRVELESERSHKAADLTADAMGLSDSESTRLTSLVDEGLARMSEAGEAGAEEGLPYRKSSRRIERAREDMISGIEQSLGTEVADEYRRSFAEASGRDPMPEINWEGIPWEEAFK